MHAPTSAGGGELRQPGGIDVPAHVQQGGETPGGEGSPQSQSQDPQIIGTVGVDKVTPPQGGEPAQPRRLRDVRGHPQHEGRGESQQPRAPDRPRLAEELGEDEDEGLEGETGDEKQRRVHPRARDGHLLLAEGRRREHQARTDAEQDEQRRHPARRGDEQGPTARPRAPGELDEPRVLVAARGRDREQDREQHRAPHDIGPGLPGEELSQVPRCGQPAHEDGDRRGAVGHVDDHLAGGRVRVGPLVARRCGGNQGPQHEQRDGGRDPETAGEQTQDCARGAHDLTSTRACDPASEAGSLV